MILLARHAGPSKLPLFPPPQCGPSNPTHALIICPEKLAGDKHPIMALHPVPSASFQITALITGLFENSEWVPLFFLLRAVGLFCCFFFLFLLVLHPLPFSLQVFSLWHTLCWHRHSVLYHTKVRWSMLTEISWPQLSLALWRINAF